jgi:tetratricopeptide (TPR) repeat protein
MNDEWSTSSAPAGKCWRSWPAIALILATPLALALANSCAAPGPVRKEPGTAKTETASRQKAPVGLRTLLNSGFITNETTQTAFVDAAKLIRQGKLTEAETQFQQRLGGRFSRGEACFALALMLGLGQAFPQAEQVARDAVELLPGAALPLSVLAAMQTENGKEEEAEQSYRRALAIEQTTLTYNALILFLIDRGRYAGAEELVADALRKWPAEASLHCAQAKLLRLRGKYEEAIAAADKAVALQPNTYSSHQQKALALGGVGRTEEALTVFRRFPNDSEALWDLSNALFTRRQYAEARAAIERAMQKLHYEFRFYDLLGRILTEQSEYEGAVRALKVAIQLRPKNAEAHLSLSLALSALGRRAESESEYAEYQKLKEARGAGKQPLLKTPTRQP